MEEIDTLLSASWVLPIIPRRKIFENYSVAIDNGIIIDLLPTKKALKKYQANTSLNLNNQVLMPGLINAHTHASMNLFRSLADDLPLLDWLQNYIWPVEKKFINADTVKAGVQLAMAEMIRGGTTYFNDMYFFPLDAAEVIIKTGMRATGSLVLMNVPTKWAKNEKDYLKKIKTVYKQHPNSDLINWILMPHAPFTCSDESLREIKRLSDELNLTVHSHAHETLNDIALDVKKYHCRPLERFFRADLLNDKLSLAHVVHLTQYEMHLLKDNNVNVIHCPESNMKLGNGIANMARLAKMGINVALGTDGAASNNDLDMFGEMRSAALIAKGVTQNPTVFSDFEVLEMATINGAKAVGLENVIGSIEKGKSADIIAVDLSHYFTQPIYNPASLLVYAANRLQVSHVWVKGNLLLQEEKFKTLDIEKVLADVNQYAIKIKKFAQIPRVHRV